ncbi:hypothetical protein QR680_018272 [Steinernema hermaphroditum]|uniref:Uncharacterized protein n=1 Tax=Steinernema hermaphroditum TaxID=289476 RepID=A0AA39HHF4_9BILA|nr:hypothetical protein QR680_018272 [Steinernema hermaphroditum]
MKTKRRFGMLFDLRLHPASGKLPLVIFFCALLLSLLQDHSGWVTFSTHTKNGTEANVAATGSSSANATLSSSTLPNVVEEEQIVDDGAEEDDEVKSSQEFEERNKNKLVCRDGDGKPVDWFITVKHARKESSATITSANPSKFVEEENFVAGGAVIETIRSIAQHKDVRVEAYSDQPPGSSTAHSKCAHAKGLTAQNKETGFHLLHSMPRGPKFSKHETFRNPENWFSESTTDGSSANGQMFLCASFSSASLDNLVNILNTAQVKPYFCNGNCRLEVDSKKKYAQAKVREVLLSLGGVKFRVLYNGIPEKAIVEGPKKIQREFDLYMNVIARHNGNAYFAWKSWTHTDRSGGQESYCAEMDDDLRCMVKIIEHGFGGQNSVCFTQDHTKIILELPPNPEPR